MSQGFRETRISVQVVYLRGSWRTGGTRDTGKGREGGPSQVYHRAQSAVMTGA